MKNRHFFLLISLLILGLFIFIYGCGNPTGGGGGGGGGTSPNMGTVSGTVYVYDRSTDTYIPTQDAYVSVTAEAMTAEVTVKVDSQGKYTFTGLPHGEVTLSMTKEGYLHARTLVCNNSTVNFAQGNVGTRPTGTCTIRGTLEGLLPSPSCFDLSIHYLSGKYYSDISEFFDENTGTFEITGAGANETVYVCVGVYYSDPDIYQYNVVNTGADGSINHVVLPANANKTIEATVSLPLGYSNNYANVYIYRNQSYVANGPYVNSSSNPIVLNQIPALRSGDSYRLFLAINHPTANNYFKKTFPDITAGAHNFSMNSYSLPTLSFITHPASGETLTATTSFEWQPINWATYYKVEISNISSHFTWIGYTTNTNIRIPDSVFNLLPSGDYWVYIAAVKQVNFSGLNQMNIINNNSYTDCVLSNTDELIVTK